MVEGLKKFKERFSGYEDSYVIIGGVACSVLFDDVGLDFRATKDYDIVLIVESLNEDFAKTIWEFVEEGEYEHINKGSGDQQFYRFEKPKDKSYPFMIELFSRLPDAVSFEGDGYITPLPVDGSIASLSAILLDDDYYKLLKEGCKKIDDLSVLDAPFVLVFKAKAYLDLAMRKASGGHVDSKTIKKHKNDVFRLASILEPGDENKLSLPKSIYEDLKQFIEKAKENPINLKDIGLANTRYEDILEIIVSYYSMHE